jgi:hypothetical protein
MSLRLTHEETPLIWPANVQLSELPTCSTCALQVSAPQPGPLQILTRRAGSGVGDGVNISEATNVAAEFRGQRYMLDEAILHVPGLHVFPDQKEVYPAEYHIHMSTVATPQRDITIVLPVSHRVAGAGQDYFAAAAAQPDAAVAHPPLSSLFSAGGKMLIYEGPDIRGRTADVPEADPAADTKGNHQFLLVLTPLQIRATDLERIPREGSLSTDPRDLPAPGVAASRKVPSDRLTKAVVLAEPGVADGAAAPVGGSGTNSPIQRELECLPLAVVDGRDVVQRGTTTIPLMQVLGLDSAASGKDVSGQNLGSAAAGTAATVLDRAKTLGPGEKVGVLAITLLVLFVGLYSFFWLLFAPSSWLRMFSVPDYTTIQRPAFGWCAAIALLVLGIQSILLFS